MISTFDQASAAEPPREDITPVSYSIFNVPKACKKSDLDHVCLEAVDAFCKWLESHGGTMEITDAYDQDSWYLALQLTSAMMGLLFFAFVYYTKELQVHPMKLIMVQAIVESAFQFFLIEQFYVCQFDLHYLFSWTVFFTDEAYYLGRSVGILMYSCIYGSCLCVTFSSLINTMLCIDLILMVRYPFDKKESRFPMYIIISVILTIPAATMMSFSTEEVWLKLGSGLGLTYALIFIATFVISIIYACKKLNGPGFSK